MSSRHERLLEITKSRIDRGVELGVGRLRTEDEVLEGAFLTVDGQRVVDFGSCSYLGLNRDERLQQAAIDAVSRFGTSHASSVTYTALGMYRELEHKLEQVFDAPVAVAATTTLAHLAALPVLIGPEDVALIDQHAHASLQLGCDVLRGRGTRVAILPHNDLDALEEAVASEPEDAKVWYIADGIYSMFGDLAPVKEVHPLLDRYPNLHVYYDDAHGFGWQGQHGRGYVLSEVPWHPRMVVAAGLSKSFGTNGAVLAFGDAGTAKTVAYCGSTFVFSGPIQTASLGASIASADFHLSPEHPIKQQELRDRIRLAGELLSLHGLPVVGNEQTPIWFVRVGAVKQVIQLVRDLMADGYYVNPAGYPVVPLGSAGIRFTQTLHQSEDQLRGLIAAIASHLPSAEPDIIVDLRSEVPSVKNP
jgi:7-keto-8-aminopelargonate synthetase-like enzyme